MRERNRGGRISGGIDMQATVPRLARSAKRGTGHVNCNTTRP